jgi:hypothetical protein
MTKEQIAELRRLDEAASPDWSGLSHGNLYIWPYGALSTEDTDPQYNHEQAKANGELAQAARSALRRLLDEREALLGALKRVEWAKLSEYEPCTPFCPECNGRYKRHETHCVVALAIAKAEAT